MCIRDSKPIGNRVDNMIVKFPIAMKCAFGENPKRCYQNQGISSRMTNASMIRGALSHAKLYKAKKEAAGDDISKLPSYDQKAEALIPVLNHEILSLIHILPGVLNTLYDTGGSLVSSTFGAKVADNASGISEILSANFTQAQGLAFIFAINFNMPCFSALAATARETHSVKWTAKIGAFYTAAALSVSCIVSVSYTHLDVYKRQVKIIQE